MVKRRRTENQVKLEDIKGFLEEFQGESDRAAAVLGAAYLDECLRQLIAAFLIDDSTRVDDLLERPLGNFASRISASYCMGLISEDEYHDLHGLSFSTAWVIEQCSALQLPKKVPQWPGPPDARNLFILTTAFLSHQLKLRTLQQTRQRRVVPSEFEVVETVH